MIDIDTEKQIRRKHLDVIKQEIREKLLHIGADEQQIKEILTLAVFMHALGYFYSEKDSVINELLQRGTDEITLEDRQHWSTKRRKVYTRTDTEKILYAFLEN